MHFAIGRNSLSTLRAFNEMLIVKINFNYINYSPAAPETNASRFQILTFVFGAFIIMIASSIRNA